MSGLGQGTALGGLAGLGGAAGSQAQFNQHLQALNKLADAAANLPTGTSYQTNSWTAAGDLDIATSFPNSKAGIFSIRQTVPAAINVTLPNTAGPWTVGDGAGVASGDNITVLPPGGNTINGAANFVIATDWKFTTFVLDSGTTNFIVYSGL